MDDSAQSMGWNCWHILFLIAHLLQSPACSGAHMRTLGCSPLSLSPLEQVCQGYKTIQYIYMMSSWKCVWAPESSVHLILSHSGSGLLSQPRSVLCCLLCCHVVESHCKLLAWKLTRQHWHPVAKQVLSNVNIMCIFIKVNYWDFTGGYCKVLRKDNILWSLTWPFFNCF